MFILLFTTAIACNISVKQIQNTYQISSDCKILKLKYLDDQSDIVYQQVNDNNKQLIIRDLKPNQNYIKAEFENNHYYTFKLEQQQKNKEFDLLTQKEVEIQTQLVYDHLIQDIKQAFIKGFIIILISYCLFPPRKQAED